MRKQLTNLRDKQWIEPSQSPYGAPILFVGKKDGSLRMCIDYRALNKITVKNRFALPRIDDLLDRLHGARVFTSLDLAQGYHQIRVTDADVPKTAFRTPIGHFQYKVLPFGLTNAPATFQAVMNEMFLGMDEYVLVYLDDILVFSKTEEEHLQHVRKVFEVLRTHKFYAKRKKCNFMQRELLYLGHILNDEGLRPDPAKVAAVETWAVPQDLHQLRSFLGFANYFRKFIQGFSKLVTPLTELTRNGVPYVWSPECQTAYEGVKHALITAPTLLLADPTKPYEVVCDASGFALGAVLFQDGQPLAYESRKMNPAERNYSATEQELLAVVHALRTWRCYLEGAKAVTLVTDHRPLTFLSSQQTLSRRQARWSEFLQRFDCQWVYRPGRLNVADPLSRQPRHLAWMVRSSTRVLEERSGREGGLAILPFPGPACLALYYRASEAVNPAALSDLRQMIREGYAGDPLFLEGQGNGYRDKVLRSSDGFWYHGKQVVVPKAGNVRALLLGESHDPPYRGHMGVAKTCEAVLREFWWPGLTRDVSAYVLACPTCQRDKPRTGRVPGQLQPLTPPFRKWESIGMDLITDLPVTPRGHDSILVFVDRLSKMVHFAPTTKSAGADEMARLYVDKVWSLHGLQSEIVSDRDPRFTGHFWKEVLRIVGTKQAMSTAFHPQTDGQTERVNRILEDYLRHYVGPAPDVWDQLLPVAEYAINNAHQESIGTTPFFLNFGQHPLNPLQPKDQSTSPWTMGVHRTPDPWCMRGAGSDLPPAVTSFVRLMSEALQRARQTLLAAQSRQKLYADRARAPLSFEEGSEVLLSTANLKMKTYGGTRKLWPRFIGPFKVLRRIGEVAYELALPDHMKVHPVFHVSLLKRYRSDGRIQPPPPPVELEGDLEYEVEAIQTHRIVRKGRSSRHEYLVKWLGYGVEHSTWEQEGNLTNCQELLDLYWKAQTAGTRARAARGVPAQPARNSERDLTGIIATRPNPPRKRRRASTVLRAANIKHYPSERGRSQVSQGGVM